MLAECFLSWVSTRLRCVKPRSAVPRATRQVLGVEVETHVPLGLCQHMPTEPLVDR
jgi:hypothetical protein